MPKNSTRTFQTRLPWLKWNLTHMMLKNFFHALVLKITLGPCYNIYHIHIFIDFLNFRPTCWISLQKLFNKIHCFKFQTGMGNSRRQRQSMFPSPRRRKTPAVETFSICVLAALSWYWTEINTSKYPTYFWFYINFYGNRLMLVASWILGKSPTLLSTLITFRFKPTIIRSIFVCRVQWDWKSQLKVAT